MFAGFGPLHHAVDVLRNRPLTDQTRRLLEAVVTSANRVVGFRGNDQSICLTVNVAGMTRNDASARLPAKWPESCPATGTR